MRAALRRMQKSAVVLVLATAMVACGSGGAEVGGSTVHEQFAEVMKRPDIDEAVARYEEVVTRVRARLAAEIPAIRWERTSDGSRAACGFDYPDLSDNGTSRWLPRWKSPGNIPDDTWGRVEAVVGEVTRPYGFQGPAVIVNRPADHEVVFQDSYGARLTIGTGKNTVLDLETGCHLTREAHQRGRPV